MSLVSISIVAEYCGVVEDDSTLLIIHPAVEQQVQNILNRDLIATTYYGERYPGTGTPSLILKNYPTIEILRVSSEINPAFTIENSSSDAIATIAFVDSDNSRLRLQVVGGTNEHAWVNFAYSTYTTFALLISAINSYGSGWSATISDSDYSAYSVEYLLRQTYDNCHDGAQSILFPSNFINVHIRHEAGMIYRYGGAIFSKGTDNIIVSHKSGFETLPSDMIFAICQLVNESLLKHGNSFFAGLKRWSLGDVTIELYSLIEMNPTIKSILDKYKRRLI